MTAPHHTSEKNPISAVRMLARRDETVAIIDIFEPISARDHDGVFSARKCVSMIDYAREGKATKLVLRINSPGGEVIEALAIYDLLRGSGLQLEAEIYGIAASAATIVALACPIIRMAPQSQWMVHEPETWIEGDLEELRRQTEFFDGVRKKVFDIYAAATGKTPEQVAADHKNEVFYTPAEAKAYGWPVELLSDEEAETVEEEAIPDPADEPEEKTAATAEDDETIADPADDPDNDDLSENEDRDEDTPAPAGQPRGLLGALLRRRPAAKSAADHEKAELRARLSDTQRQLAAANGIIARMQQDARATSDNLVSALNAREAAVMAAGGCGTPISATPTPTTTHHTRAELSKVYRHTGLAGLLSNL